MPEEKTHKNKLELLGRLTASLAHELRNPLSALKLNIQYAELLDFELPQEIQESLKDCSAAIDRIEELVESILSFSKKEVGVSRPVSLNELTLAAISFSHSKIGNQVIKISHCLSEENPIIQFRRNSLLQVFLNLIANAIDACQTRGGEIKISTFTESDGSQKKVIWQIEDDGIGIKEEDKFKIFDDFFTNKPSGTGLGLSVCRSILKHNNAQLNFESEYQKGSKFLITFTF